MMQIDISSTDENGNGTGYRIAGPKFSGNSEFVASHTISQRDIKEIREYLDIAGREHAKK